MSVLRNITYVGYASTILLVTLNQSVFAAVSLKIFIYDLPKWKNWTATGNITASDYGLDQIFPEVLKASPYVTTNPEEADYFFADAWIFWPHALNPIDDIVAEIKSQGPWFERKGGRDHIFVITADQGRCQYFEKSVQHAIFLQHYGGSLHGTDFFGYNLTQRWGGTFDRLMVMTEALRANDPCSIPHIRCAEDTYGRRTPALCHIPHQDIVVAPASFEVPADREDCHHCHNALASNIPYLHPEAAAFMTNNNRSTILFHAGSTHFHHDPIYSIGARQTMIEMFGRGRKQGYLLHESGMGADYWKNLMSSVFCLATTGTGWGSRFKAGLVRGCIPVIMMDGIKNEFEDELPLMEYAIRIPGYMAFKTPQILDHFISSGRAAQMQENIKCAWRLHWWTQPHGKALEVVMCALKMRKASRMLPGETYAAFRLRTGGRPLQHHQKIRIDFKACTMTCEGETINLLQ